MPKAKTLYVVVGCSGVPVATSPIREHAQKHADSLNDRPPPKHGRVALWREFAKLHLHRPYTVRAYVPKRGG
jgi:hypothetical protein